MTNEETLKLLKPIMLDGSEKEGDKVYHIRYGEVGIQGIRCGATYSIHIQNGSDIYSSTSRGFSLESDMLPILFKTNPYEWLSKQKQEREIEVFVDNHWEPRVLIKVVDGVAVCWVNARGVDEAQFYCGTSTYLEWRELPTKITKEEALKMLAERGVDTTNLIIE